MKKKLLFLMALLAVSLFVMAEMTIYVYKKDGTKVAYVASSVDSIGFVDVNCIADGHEWVDLGLPSGTKWATMNVGADSPEEYGDYFAWGETTPKSTYNWSTYKWYDGSSDTYTKYCTDSDYGTVDNKTTLDLSDDAAYVNWGTSWRMPTNAELKELKDNCTWTWTTQNGVNGYKVTSKKNGNSIFLPAAGYRSDSSLYGSGSNGDYWTSSLSAEFSSYSAHELYFRSDEVYMRHSPRTSGRSVRAVLREIYTLGFDANGGSGSMSAVELERNESKNIPANTFTRLGYRFIGWNTAADGSGTAYADQASITPNANLTLYAQWEETTTGTENGHEWVDLGLPSGTLWATMNVGADSPEDYGDYFAWGEITPNSNYTYSKNSKVLSLSDDAANANWGGAWRMPTKAELDELINSSYTTCTWTGNGCKVTSKINGNSIFLPAAGSKSTTGYYDPGMSGDYLSNTAHSLYNRCVYVMVFDNYHGVVVQATDDNATSKKSVRPVLKK